MIIEWILKKLQDKLFKEKHEVMKLRWQKAELERRIAQANKNIK